MAKSKVVTAQPASIAELETDVMDVASMLQICTVLVDRVNADMKTWEDQNISLRFVRKNLRDERDLLTWAIYRTEQMSRTLVEFYEDDVDSKASPKDEFVEAFQLVPPHFHPTLMAQMRELAQMATKRPQG